MVYLPTFTININQMWANIPYMDPVVSLWKWGLYFSSECCLIVSSLIADSDSFTQLYAQDPTAPRWPSIMMSPKYCQNPKQNQIHHDTPIVQFAYTWIPKPNSEISVRESLKRIAMWCGWDLGMRPKSQGFFKRSQWRISLLPLKIPFN